MAERRYVCFCCLREEAVTLRFDRKSRPYTICGWCGSRTFIHSPEGLRGLMLLEREVAAVLHRLGSVGVASADEQIHGWIARAGADAAAAAGGNGT